MKSKILITEELSEEGVQKLKAEMDVDVVKGMKHEELLKKIKDYDALIVRSATKVNRELINAGVKLKVIGRAGVGIDNVDVDAATEKGIIVVNAPEGSTISVAEHTIAMLMSLSRKIPQACSTIRDKKWEKSKFMGTQVYDKTLGIVGIGRIGAEVAKRAHGLGMKVIAYDPFINSERAKELGVSLVTLDELLGESDYISIHTPLTKETKNLIGVETFKKMKNCVRIINCARGGIIDEKALAEAIKSGKVGGVALDVFENEPPKDSPLLAMDEVIATPHIAASTQEAQVSVAVTIAEQVLAALKGGPVKNAVNMYAVKPEVFEAIRPYLSLAEKLGKLASQLAPASIESLEISYHGEIAEKETELTTTAILKGVLELIISNVNYVNAPLIIKNRGMKVVKVKTWAIENFTSLISVRAMTGKGDVTVAGTVFGKNDARVVKIDGCRINAFPSGYMLIAKHLDKPKVIGPVGMVLGEAGINISGMQVSRIKSEGQEAIMVLNVDSAVSDEILKKMQKIDGIIDVKLAVL